MMKLYFIYIYFHVWLQAREMSFLKKNLLLLRGTSVVWHCLLSTGLESINLINLIGWFSLNSFFWTSQMSEIWVYAGFWNAWTFAFFLYSLWCSASYPSWNLQKSSQFFHSSWLSTALPSLSDTWRKIRQQTFGMIFL